MRTSRLFLQFMRATVGLLLFLSSLPGALAQRQPPAYENPVIAGDFPDPSVIRAGQDYWATATSGGWAPEFPILHSRDLVHWEVKSAVFTKRPAWARGDFWAPEISEHGGRYFIYYTARKKGGPLCVAAASAANPDGPYTDHGPLVCQGIGSIDAMAVTDERGERYLVWKEDGNSRGKPTPIWAQQLNPEGTKLIGSRRELIRNDPHSWEGGVVEGAFILRHNDWFYLFYSGNACCGRSCNYALGVARSKRLLGPWEKNPSNPILAENEAWQCPGHGSIVTDASGRYFLLYHAYQKSDEAFFIGREALLDEVQWSASGWPTINNGKGPSGRSMTSAKGDGRPHSFFDDFNSQRLGPGWQWPQDNEPKMYIEPERGGRLVMTALGKHAKDPIGTVVSQPATSADYTATTVIDTSGMGPKALAGLSAYGWREEAIGILAGDGKIMVYTREKNKHQVSKTLNVPHTQLLYLRMTVTDGSHYRFAYSSDGRDWKALDEEINGSFLEGARISLTVGGTANAVAKFEWLRIEPS